VGTHKTSRYLGAAMAVFGALFMVISVSVQIMALVEKAKKASAK
jgi:hypothetical protein